MSASLGSDAQSSLDRLSVSAIRAWAGFYTRGLRAELAEDRRDVIDADLWDEAEAARWLGETSGLSRQRWSRWLRGIPADVSWRFDQQRRASTMARRVDMPASKAVRAAIGAVTILYVLMIVGLLASPSFREWSGMGAATLGLSLSVIGLLMVIRRPQAGFIVGIIGTGLALLSMPWLFPFFVPLPVVLLYGLSRAQRSPQPNAPGT